MGGVPNGEVQLAPHSYYAIAPCWMLTLLFSLLPTGRIIRRVRRRQRVQAGHCPTCNYDLQATPNRCPGMRHRTST